MPEVADARANRELMVDTIRVQYNQEALASCDMPMANAAEQVSTAMNGQKLGEVIKNQDHWNIVLRIDPRLKTSMEDVKNRNLDGISKKISNYDKLAEELGIGAITLQDIVKELEKPARDPREDMPKPILRSDVLEMKDLTPGMVLKGTVRNVIDFGAFVDIGVHQDGLVHISQMSDKFIKHPLEVVSDGDNVEVKVMSVEL